MSYLIGGIEGGSTHSNAVIMESSGKVIGRAKGPETNYHLLGMKECRKRIAYLTDKAKIDAGLPTDQPLDALGLSLSGAESEEANNEFLEGIYETYPNLAKKIILSSDTDGSIATTSNKGGVTCIAGTGSNTLLINPDGTKAQCGGWGNFLGDEGSAYKITHDAIKYCFDDLDNFSKTSHPIDRVWNLVKEHFKIRIQSDILPYFSNFNKAFISSLCIKLADLARDGDELAIKIFRDAGRDLARGIAAVYPKASKELTDREGGLHVLCVGSVWLSFDLLFPGFIGWLECSENIDKLSLLKLHTDMGVGAAYLASDKLDLPLERDYSKNYTVFYRYRRGDSSNMNGCS